MAVEIRFDPPSELVFGFEGLASTAVGLTPVDVKEFVPLGSRGILEADLAATLRAKLGSVVESTDIDNLRPQDLATDKIYRDIRDVGVRVQIPTNRVDVVVQDHTSAIRGYVKDDTGGIVYDPSGYVVSFVETFIPGSGGNADSYTLSLAGLQTTGSPFSVGPLSILAVVVGSRMFTLENRVAVPTTGPRTWTSAPYSTRLFPAIAGLHQVTITIGVPNSAFSPAVLHNENFLAKFADDHKIAELRAQLDGVHEILETQIADATDDAPIRLLGAYNSLTIEQRAALVVGNVVTTGGTGQTDLQAFWIVGNAANARTNAPTIQTAAEDNGWELLTETSHWRGIAHVQSEYYHAGDIVLVGNDAYLTLTPGDFTAAQIPTSNNFLNLSSEPGTSLTPEQLKLIGDIPGLELKTQDIEVHTVNDWETSTDVTFKFSGTRLEGAAILAGSYVSTQTWDATESIANNWCIIRVPANIDRHKVQLHQVSVGGAISDHSFNHFGLVASTGTGANAARYYEGQIDLKNNSTITVQVDQVVGHRTEYHGRTFYDNIEGIPGHSLNRITDFLYQNHWDESSVDSQAVYFYGNAKDIHRHILVTALDVHWKLDTSHHVPQQLRLFVGKVTSAAVDNIAGSTSWQRVSDIIINGESQGQTASIPATTAFDGIITGVLSNPIECEDGDILAWLVQLNIGQAAAAPGQLVGAFGTDEDSHVRRSDVGGDVITQRAKLSSSANPGNPSTVPNQNRNIYHSTTFSLKDGIHYIDLESERLRLDKDGSQIYNGPSHVNLTGAGVSVSVENGIATVNVPGVTGDAADGVISGMTFHLDPTTRALSATIQRSVGGNLTVSGVSFLDAMRTLIATWARVGNNDVIPAAKHRLAAGNTRGAVGGAGTNALVDAGTDSLLRGWSAAHLARAVAQHQTGGSVPNASTTQIGIVRLATNMQTQSARENPAATEVITIASLQHFFDFIRSEAAIDLDSAPAAEDSIQIANRASIINALRAVVTMIGTTVEANPSGTDGDVLQRAAIDGTNYRLGIATFSVTQAEYDALSDADRNATDRLYVIR